MKNATLHFSVIAFAFLILSCTNNKSRKESSALKKPPNFVLIFTDDQGYGDLSCFGSQEVNTPAIDQLAKEGAKLTSFYVAASICTPSRAALMTGSYPKRVSMATGSTFVVPLAGDAKGLHPDEITIAEVLKKRGYATGIFGKWHLGDQPEFLPTRQGFDEFFGIPYSHDIHPFHPDKVRFNFPPLPLLDGEEVIELDPDAAYLTKRITDRAVEFIEQHQKEPFFLYIPHPMPHAPLHVSPTFMATVADSVKTQLALENGRVNYTLRRKLFPQVISEIDWSVKQIVDAIRNLGLAQNTLLIFTTDNGAAIGSSGPLRGKKGSHFEGGLRVPAIAWWPGKIQAGIEIDEILTAMDLLPTFAKLAGSEPPTDRVIDGKDIWPLLSAQDAQTPHERFYYYRLNQLMAVRSGPWKYHQILLGSAENAPSTALYHLDNDIGETQDLSAQHPEVVARLKSYLETFEKELGKGDSLSSNCRPAGWIEDPKPLSLEGG